MHCMEGILVCCQINEFDVSYFLHCKKWWKNHLLFNISIPFMVLWALPFLSHLFLFPDWKELVYLISYDTHSMLMIILAGFQFSNATLTNDSSSYDFHKDPESLVWKLNLSVLKWKPTYLISPLFFISYWYFLQRKAIHRHEILQSVPLPFLCYTKLLNLLVHSSGTLVNKSIGVFN